MRLMLCSATAIGFVVCAFPSSCTNAAPADRCQSARAHEKHVGTEITDPRVMNALSAAVEASGFQHDVIICEIYMPNLNATVGRLGKYYYIGVTKSVLEEFTDAEFQAVLGHEMAHIVLGHRDPGFELTNRRTARYEEAADALSVKWFDKGAMQSVLKKLRVNARSISNEQMRNRAVTEIDARIKALQ
jgi:Zn-dependent protease with chaperone function